MTVLTKKTSNRTYIREVPGVSKNVAVVGVVNDCHEKVHTNNKGITKVTSEEAIYQAAMRAAVETKKEYAEAFRELAKR